MDRFQSVELFVRVVETGSFSVTARESAVSQATVSKQVSELENFLNVKLLARTTRQLRVTEEGQRFYRDAKRLLENLNQAIGSVRSIKETPSGTLRISTPVMFGRSQVITVLPKFQELYPDIVIEHRLADAPADLVKEGLDIALSVGVQPDSTHRSRRLGAIRRATVASPDFLKKHGTPLHPSELSKIPCVVSLGVNGQSEWHYDDPLGDSISVVVSGIYRSDTTEALRQAALAGLGVYCAPLSTCHVDICEGRLVRILHDFEPDPVPIYAVMPTSSFFPQKTRVFIDFLRKQFKENSSFVDLGTCLEPLQEKEEGRVMSSPA